MNASDADRKSELVDTLAAEPLDQSDLKLLASLRACLEAADPVPRGLVERLQFEITLDALHAEVATLTRLDPATSGARGVTEEAQTITFTSDSLTTMVTLTPQGEGVRVDGWAAPGAGIRVEVLLSDGSRETHADADGRFVFDEVPSGLAKFALYLRDGDTIATVISPTIEL